MVRAPSALFGSTSAVIAATLWFSACSPSHAPGFSGGVGGQVGAGGSGTGGARFDGGQVSPDLGAVIVDIPAGGDCVPVGGTRVTLSTSPNLGTAFVRTGPVGTRRFAFGADSNVLMTFAPDGTSPSPLVFGPVAVAARDQIAALSIGAATISVSFYDANAAPAGAALTVDTAAGDAPSIAFGAQGVLAVYRAGGAIRGRLVRNGALAGSFDLGAPSGGSGAAQTAVVADDQGFGIVTNRHELDGTTRTTWARVSAAGSVVLTKSVFVSQGKHQLFDLARWPTGYLALLGEGDPGHTAVLVSLDEFGNVVPPARRLLGASFPLGLAVNGTTTLVAGLFADGRAVVRALDAAGSPLGPFVCVDNGVPDSGFYAQAGVAAQGTGWGIVSRMADLSAAYRVTNLTATGAP